MAYLLAAPEIQSIYGDRAGARLLGPSLRMGVRLSRVLGARGGVFRMIFVGSDLSSLGTLRCPVHEHHAEQEHGDHRHEAGHDAYVTPHSPIRHRISSSAKEPLQALPPPFIKARGVPRAPNVRR